MTHTAFLTDPILAAASNVLLLSVFKAIILLPAIVVYMRIASSHIEKDARRMNLAVSNINLVIVIGALVAYLSVLLIPIFWVGWPVSIIILAGTLFIYMKWRNAKVDADQKFELVGTKLEDAKKARQSRKAEKSVDLRFIDPNGKEHKVPLVEDPLHLVHKELEQIMTPALESNASAVTMLPGKQGTTITRTVDTMQYKQEVVQPETGERVIDYLKALSLLAVDDRRRIQQGSLKMMAPSGYMELDLTTSGSSAGQRVRIDIDRSSRIGRAYNKIGLLPVQKTFMDSLNEIEQRHGIMLLCAPEGQGLSTTAYALLGRHDAFSSVVKSCEKRIDLAIQGADQQEWKPDSELGDHATTVRTILRRDPDVLLVDDISEPGSANIISKSGIDGPLIYIAFRAENLAEGVSKWVRNVGDLEQASKGLIGITVSRVLRQLCPACRQQYQPDEAQLKKMGMGGVTDAKFNRASGKVQVKNKVVPCDACSGTGYTGTIGVFEVIPFDTPARMLISKNDLKGAYRHVRKMHKMPTLQEAALARVRSGETSLDEVVRVLAPKKNPQAKSAPAASAKATN
ncbi:MAG: ATPase, T2SS/T4P/T4SS family [Phycisphaerales bacterium]|nr:ATPase, T2SS/T4P/T4SS family [Phycisphaerales bacterium]